MDEIQSKQNSPVYSAPPVIYIYLSDLSGQIKVLTRLLSFSLALEDEGEGVRVRV